MARTKGSTAQQRRQIDRQTQEERLRLAHFWGDTRPKQWSLACVAIERWLTLRGSGLRWRVMLSIGDFWGGDGGVGAVVRIGHRWRLRGRSLKSIEKEIALAKERLPTIKAIARKHGFRPQAGWREDNLAAELRLARRIRPGAPLEPERQRLEAFLEDLRARLTAPK